MSALATMIVLTCATTLADAEPRFFEPTAWSTAQGASPAEIERSRITQHLRFVEETLRRETPTNLSAGRRKRRARAMDALHEYSERVKFPTNGDAPRRTPVFIDAEGTPCAFGYLLIASGAESLAREIATYENNEFVADIGHPELAGWLEAHGLTSEEAAWVQPNYGPCGYPGFIDQLVCGADGQTYECDVAAECARVEVVSMGSCSSGSSRSSGSSGTSTGTGGTGGTTGTGGTEPPAEDDVVLAEDVCEFGTTGTSTGENATTDDTQMTDGSSTSGGDIGSSSSSSGSGPSGSSSGLPGSEESEGSGGCRVGGPGLPPLTWAAVFLLVVRRRRQA